jgi:hypothetical protein
MKAYADLFKGWQAKALGSKPGDDLLTQVHGLGLRPGKQALANAMALRPEGVSGSQIVMACGAQQLNRMRGLIAAGVVKREAVAPNEQGHTVYKITLTAKGANVIKRAAEAADKATLATTAKPAKAKRKPRKAKAVTVTAEAASEPQAASEPVTGETVTGEPQAQA